MQFSELWLRSFVSPDLDTDQLGHLLTMAGLEVEEQDGVAAAFSKVVVAQIVEAEKLVGGGNLAAGDAGEVTDNAFDFGDLVLLQPGGQLMHT